MAFDDTWDSFTAHFREGLEVLVANTFDDFTAQAQEDARAFMIRSEAQLKRWGEAWAKGLLSEEEFDSLVTGQASLARLHMLTAAGLAQTRLERFRKGLLALVTGSMRRALGV
ncbi:hypothetical protein [Mesobacterium pallidum]|uniref:hypothetical protein n=1 Tax=Mesobacterium pallidum TaxID=2872037 RepID=UPI001EE1F7D0|nr:hypothetical protein [Mesobacterium pallidum]